jgi:hypothetical protein
MLCFKQILLISVFLKNLALLSKMMFHNKTIMAALFTIAIASSLIAVSGFVGFAYAAKKDPTSGTGTGTVPTLSMSKEDKKKDNQSDLPAVLRPESKSDPQKTPSAYGGDSSGSAGDTNGVSAKALKGLSKCQSHSAADGDLTLAEVKDCYSKEF